MNAILAQKIWSENRWQTLNPAVRNPGRSTEGRICLLWNNQGNKVTQNCISGEKTRAANGEKQYLNGATRETKKNSSRTIVV